MNDDSFKPLLAWCKKKSVDLTGFQDFVALNERLNKVHTYLKQNIDLEGYSLYLEKKESPSATVLAEWKTLAEVGYKLLTDKKVLVEELNVLLKNIPADQLNAIKLLHQLLLQKKIRVAEMVDFLQPNWTLVQEEENKFSFQILEGHPQFRWRDRPPEKRLGNYEILEELGRGGMGAVYKVYHPHLQQTFALKVLIAGENASEKTLRRFHREVQTLAKLKHPGIIQIYDSGRENNQHYFAMEFVDGKTLKSLLEDEPPLRERIEIFQKVLDALFYAHEEGIIHRDLKPENLFVSKDGTPKIGDFGLAKDTQEDEKLTLSGAILGTLRYMSPEQARGDQRHLDHRSDLYSIGVCLYEAVVGRMPYEAKNAQQLLDKIGGEDPYPPSRLDQHIHRDLEAILLKSLEKEPFRRYQTAKDFANDLESFLKGYPILARPASVSEKCWKWTRRNRYKVFLINIIFWSVLLFFGWLHGTQTQHLQNQAQALYDKSLSETLAGEKLSEKDTVTIQQKIAHWLSAFTLVNEALQIQKDFQKAKNHKWETGKRLLYLSLDLESYQFANYVLEEMKNIPDFSTEAKDKLTQQIKDRQQRTLQQHQSKLARFLHSLQQGKLSEAEREDGIFLISQFSEEEILQHLYMLARTGEQYFLHEALRTPEKNLFYETIIVILGRSRSSRIAPFFREALTKMQQKIERGAYSASDEIELLSYMIVLAQALGNVGGEPDAELIEKLRIAQGEFGFFSRRTRYVHRKLLRKLPEQIRPQTAEEFFKRANRRRVLEQLAEALPDYDQAIHLDSKMLKAYDGRGETRYDLGDFSGACADFEKMMELDPKCVEAYCDAATTREDMGEIDIAITIYQQVLRFDSLCARALAGLGKIYHQKKEYPKALDYFNQAIQSKPLLEIYNNRAILKVEMGDNQGALEDYHQALLRDPFSNVPYLNRGNLRKTLKNFDGALADYNRAIELDPQLDTAYRFRGEVKKEKGDFLGALVDFNEAVRLNPKEILNYSARAPIRERLKETEGAIQDYAEIVKQRPKNAQEWFKMAGCKVALQRFAEAASDYSRAIELHPESSTPYFRRGETYIMIGKISEALIDYNKALELEPNHVEGTYIRGSIYSKLGKYKEAIENYTRALQLDPKYTDAYLHRGVARLNLNDWEGALNDFNQTIQLDPKNASGYNNRGAIKQILKEWDAAIADHTKAIELEPVNLSAYNNRGYAKFGKGDPLGAIADYNKVLEFDPQYPDGYNKRGLARARLQDFARAIDDYTQAIRLQANFDGAYNNRGSAKHALKDFEGALADYTIAIQLNPKNHESYINRGNTRKEKGDLPGMRQDFRKYLELTQSFGDEETKKFRQWILKSFPECGKPQ